MRPALFIAGSLIALAGCATHARSDVAEARHLIVGQWNCSLRENHSAAALTMKFDDNGLVVMTMTAEHGRAGAMMVAELSVTAEYTLAGDVLSLKTQDTKVSKLTINGEAVDASGASDSPYPIVAAESAGDIKIVILNATTLVLAKKDGKITCGR